MKYYVSFDIGGTSIKHGVIDETGEIVTRGEVPTEARTKGGPGIIEKVKYMITDYQTAYTLSGICVSTAGMVDCEKGEVFYASPLIPDYTGTKIKEILEYEFGIPCEVENDVNCAGLAESISGAGKGHGICLCLTIGTGIGGCIVMGQKVYHGYSNSACEVGYIKIDGAEYQELASSRVLVQKVEGRRGLKPGTLNGKIIFQGAGAGDETCMQAINEMTEVIGKGIATICYVLNPEIVILGGGIMAQKEYLYDKIKAAMEHHLIPAIAERTKLAFAEHQNEAGMLGAFYHFRNRQAG